MALRSLPLKGLWQYHKQQIVGVSCNYNHEINFCFKNGYASNKAHGTLQGIKSANKIMKVFLKTIETAVISD